MADTRIEEIKLRIKKVTKIEHGNKRGLEVVIDDNGEESIQCFDGVEEWFEEDENGESKLVKQLKKVMPALRESKQEEPVSPKKTELTKFKDKEVTE